MEFKMKKLKVQITLRRNNLTAAIQRQSIVQNAKSMKINEIPLYDTYHIDLSNLGIKR